MSRSSRTPPRSASLSQTWQRLLEVGGEVFAEKGFERATVREICDKAGANVAAVNYHFGGKLSLYKAVVTETRRRAYETNRFAALDTRGDLHADKPPAERLRLFLHMMMGLAYDARGERSRYALLMMHEMIQPTAGLDQFVRDAAGGMWAGFKGICADLMPAGTGEEQVRAVAISVIGQVFYLVTSQPMITRLEPSLRFTEADLERHVEHIWRFSLAGVRGFARVTNGE